LHVRKPYEDGLRLLELVLGDEVAVVVLVLEVEALGEEGVAVGVAEPDELLETLREAHLGGDAAVLPW
jgi:hypothetical protein